MASFQKTDKGWRVFVAKKGFRKSATFKTKREANEWAARMEISASERAKDGIPNIPFTDLLNRYIDEVSVNKKGERWERLRLQLIGRMAIGKVMLPDLFHYKRAVMSVVFSWFIIWVKNPVFS